MDRDEQIKVTGARLRSILLTLIALTTIAGGCNTLEHIPQSSFLSKFSLERSVKQTAYKGINHSQGPGGSIGGISGGTSEVGGNRASLSSSTAFMIYQEGVNRFIESEFMEALASQTRKEIEERGASITGSGSPAPNEFYVDYKDGKINGRITILGSARGQFYVLDANVNEGGGHKRASRTSEK